MAVSDKTRKEVKARANGCCQIMHRTEYRGEDGTPMDIIHRHHSGMGGQSSEHWTNDKKNLLFGCRRCHDMLHHPTKALQIVDMDPDHEEDGVPYPVLKIVDHNGIEIPQRNIWLFARIIKDQLGQLLTSVRGDRMFESDRANAMLQLFDNYDLITPDAASPEQMLGSEGFDTEVAMKQIKAAAWIDKHQLEWPRGLVTSKVNKFRAAAQKRLWESCDKEQVQRMLIAATDQSNSDITEEFLRFGITIMQPRMYVALWESGKAVLARVSDITKLKDKLKPMGDPMVMSIHKAEHGFSIKRGKNAFTIRDRNGNEIPHWTDEDLERDELVEISWVGDEK